MYKPDEKDIDRLSREAAEQYHAPGKPAWNALQQILDKELPQEEERKRRGFFFFFFLLLGLSLTGSVLWYGIQVTKNKQHRAATAIKDKSTEAAISNRATAVQALPPAAPNHAAAQPSGSNAEKNGHTKNTDIIAGNNADGQDATAPLIDKTVGNTLNKTAPATQQISSVAQPVITTGNGVAAAAVLKSAHHTPANSHKKINGTVIISDRTLAAGSRKTPGKNNWYKTTGNHYIPVTDNRFKAAKHGPKGKKTSQSFSNTEAAGDEITGSRIAAGSKAGVSTKTTATQPGEGAATIVSDPPLAADTAADKFTATHDASTVKAIAVNEKNDSAKTEQNKKTQKNNKAILIGLVGGLDISTVKFTHGDNAGYNLGLMTGYQFNRHWSAYTGIVYTKKNYKLDGSDYHPPTHYWTQYVKLQTVEGWCRMWELPVQIRYTFNPGTKSAYFVSTGLSSYFMKKQQYNYSYKNNMNQQLSAAWSNDSSFRHVFSILHLSAGFEKKLGRHMNWQIEPYAKIPLGGVGFGNIRLSSFGVNFSVQYRQRIRP